jgi:hypothetical protein
MPDIVIQDRVQVRVKNLEYDISGLYMLCSSQPFKPWGLFNEKVDWFDHLFDHLTISPLKRIEKERILRKITFRAGPSRLTLILSSNEQERRCFNYRYYIVLNLTTVQFQSS